jgi:alcohol dehydrogenase class IV
MLPDSMAFIEAANLTPAQRQRIQTVRTLFAEVGRAGDSLAAETRAWFEELGIEFGLKNHNIPADDLGNLADEAFLDPCHTTNLIPVTRDDLAAVYEKAF